MSVVVTVDVSVSVKEDVNVVDEVIVLHSTVVTGYLGIFQLRSFTPCGGRRTHMNW